MEETERFRQPSGQKAAHARSSQHDQNRRDEQQVRFCRPADERAIRCRRNEERQEREHRCREVLIDVVEEVVEWLRSDALHQTGSRAEDSAVVLGSPEEPEGDHCGEAGDGHDEILPVGLFVLDLEDMHLDQVHLPQYNGESGDDHKPVFQAAGQRTERLVRNKLGNDHQYADKKRDE